MIALSRGRARHRRPGRRQTGNVNELLHTAGLCLQRVEEVSGSRLVDLEELRDPSSFGAAGAMNDVRDARQRLGQATRIIDRAEPDFDIVQVLFDEVPAAGGTEKNGRGNRPRAEAVQDMAPDKPARSCEQDLQSDHAEFPGHLGELFETEINLRVGVRSHEAQAYEFLARWHGRRNHRIDKNTLLLQSLAHLERYH